MKKQIFLEIITSLWRYEGINEKSINLQIPNARQIILIVLITVAVFLRLYHLDYMEFKADEAFNSMKAIDLARFKSFPLTSATSSTGVSEPPVFMYLLAIPFIFTSNPVVAAGYIGILNVLAIILSYFFVRTFFSENAALICTAFFAVNPWHILFSRKIWTQNMLPLFVVLFLTLLFGALFRGRKIFIVPAGFVLGLVMQLHLAAAYFLILGGVMVLVYYKKLNPRQFQWGLFIFFITLIPYTIHLVKSDFKDFSSTRKFLNVEKPGSIKSITIPFEIVTTKGFQYSLGTDYPEFRRNTLESNMLDHLLMAILFFSIIHALKTHNRKNSFLMLWLFIGIGYLAFTGVSLQNFYFISMILLFLILIANFMDWILLHTSIRWRFAPILVIIVIIMYQLVFDVQFLTFVRNKQCIKGDYGPPYQYRKENIETIVSTRGFPKTEEQFQQLKRDASYCPKCDTLSTVFFLRYLNGDL